MKKYIFFLSYLLFFMSHLTTAQQTTSILKGYVIDAATGERLGNANLNGNTWGTTTNRYGFYSIKVPNSTPIHLTVSFLGYESKKLDLQLSGDMTLNIKLVKKSELLEEVRILSDNKKQFLTEKGLGRFTLQVQDIKYLPSFLGEKDIMKGLQMIPGVSPGTENSSNLNIRGGSPDQTLLLLDGVPVFNSNHAFGLISVFNSDAIASVDLFKGDIPAEYGDRLSGIVSLNTKDGNKQKHHQAFSISLLTASLTAEGPVKKGKASYLVNMRRSTTDLFLRMANYGDYPAFYDISGKLHWNLSPNHQLFLNLYNNKDQLNIQDNSSNVKYKNGLFWGSNIFSLHWNAVTGKCTFMNNTLYYSDRKNGKKLIIKESGSQTNSRITTTLQEIGWKTAIEHKWGTNYRLYYGLHTGWQYHCPQNIYIEKSGKSPRKQYFERTLFFITPYAGNKLYLKNFSLEAGFRLSAYSTLGKLKINPEPRLSIRLQAGADNQLLLGYNRMYQSLHSLIKLYDGYPLEFWAPFDGTHLPSAHQYSIGWKSNIIPAISFSLESYYKKMYNLLMVSNADEYLSDRNAGKFEKGYSYGIECLLKYNRKRLTGLLSYTWSHSKRQSKSSEYSFLYETPHDLNIYINYNCRKDHLRNNNFSVNIAYRSGLPYILSNEVFPDLSRPKPFEDYGENLIYNPLYPNTRLKDYFRVDLNYRIEKKMKKGTRSWQFSILNLTNHKNPYMVYRKENRYKALVLFPIMPSVGFERTF